MASTSGSAKGSKAKRKPARKGKAKPKTRAKKATKRDTKPAKPKPKTRRKRVKPKAVEKPQTADSMYVPCGTIAPRASQVEAAQRVEVAEDLLADGATVRVIARKLAKEHGITLRMGREYASRAMRNILEADDGTETVARKTLWRARLERLFLRAVTAKQYSAAVASAKECLRLDGVVDARGNVTVIIAPGGNVAVNGSGEDPLVAIFQRMADGVAPEEAFGDVVDVESVEAGDNGKAAP